MKLSITGLFVSLALLAVASSAPVPPTGLRIRDQHFLDELLGELGAAGRLTEFPLVQPLTAPVDELSSLLK